MKKMIVTTTIHPLTKAVAMFDRLKDWELVVVGDQKTPKDYHLKRGTFLTPKMQIEMDQRLSDVIGWNCIQRRNFGILYAYQAGADIVALVDDDNIPSPAWGKNLLLGRPCEVAYYSTDLAAFDPVGATNERGIWHRGYPLQLIAKRRYRSVRRRNIVPDIQADFWNGDPDIDAFCRMEHAPDCKFDPKCFPLASNKMAPFNSQNTFIMRKVLKDYFLFPHVGRMDDIWAAYYVQSRGFQVVFNKASVTQVRNPHDPIEDMKKEFLGYEKNLKLVEALAEDPNRIYDFLPDQAKVAFDLYRRHFTK